VDPEASSGVSPEVPSTQAPGGADPVTDPLGYQRLLLSMLGEDDPAEAQRQTPPALRHLIVDAGSNLRSRPRPDEWSVLECVGHIVDGEIVSTGRYRWILAHDEPPLLPYDQDLWVERLGHRDAEPDELLALFDALRTANLGLWSRTPDSDRSRIGMHQERGPESFELTFRLIAGHDRLHVQQARRTLDLLASGS
jgi:DinB superfamily